MHRSTAPGTAFICQTLKGSLRFRLRCTFLATNVLLHVSAGILLQLYIVGFFFLFPSLCSSIFCSFAFYFLLIVPLLADVHGCAFHVRIQLLQCVLQARGGPRTSHGRPVLLSPTTSLVKTRRYCRASSTRSCRAAMPSSIGSVRFFPSIFYADTCRIDKLRPYLTQVSHRPGRRQRPSQTRLVRRPCRASASR